MATDFLDARALCFGFLSQIKQALLNTTLCKKIALSYHLLNFRLLPYPVLSNGKVLREFSVTLPPPPPSHAPFEAQSQLLARPYKSNSVVHVVCALS